MGSVVLCCVVLFHFVFVEFECLELLVPALVQFPVLDEVPHYEVSEARHFTDSTAQTGLPCTRRTGDEEIRQGRGG